MNRTVSGILLKTIIHCGITQLTFKKTEYNSYMLNIDSIDQRKFIIKLKFKTN